MPSNQFPRIMLTGKNGQIGWELQRTLAPLGDVIALDRTQLDLASPDQICQRVREIKPNIIVNAAAYTAVDRAEQEKELAKAINGTAPGILAEEAKRINAVMIHYSTDYVFDGEKKTPYTEEDEPRPINVYGITKLEGEHAIQATEVPHLILRTSWVYGMRGNNFLLTIIRLAREQKELRIIDDQIGSPTWSRMIAEATALLLAQGYSVFEKKKGIYHLSCGGQTSWYGFAKKIFYYLRSDPTTIIVTPILTSDYHTPTRRPLYSLLSNEKFCQNLNLSIPKWDYVLKLAVNQS